MGVQFRVHIHRPATTDTQGKHTTLHTKRTEDKTDFIDTNTHIPIYNTLTYTQLLRATHSADTHTYSTHYAQSYTPTHLSACTRSV